MINKSKYVTGFYFILSLTIIWLPAESEAQEVNVNALKAHTGFLAHDLLEGRGTASRGEALAAIYLTSQLRAYGLEPITGDTSDYRIPVPLTAYHFDNTKAEIKIQSAAGNTVLTPPDFYHPGGAPSSFQNFSGDLLFAGSAPNALSALDGYPDLTGKVVVLTPPWTNIEEVESELNRRGAEGAVEIIPNNFYNRLRVVRGPTRFALPAEVDAPKNQSPLPTVIVGPKGATEMGVLERIRSKKKIEKALKMEKHIQIKLAVSSEEKTGYNVAALLPGADPALSDSIITYMAHYDHVGFGKPTEKDSIWNGFIDNASGTAILLEMAHVLAADPPSHPVLFLFTTAEEQGLLGATWFVHKEPIPLKKIRAVINIDGGAPPANVKSWTVAASDEYDLGVIASEALKHDGWKITSKSIISDSDHWAFHRAGVPSLFLYPGSQATTKYIHTADDEWQVDFPFEGLVHYAETALQIIDALEP